MDKSGEPGGRYKILPQINDEVFLIEVFLIEVFLPAILLAEINWK